MWRDKKGECQERGAVQVGTVYCVFRQHR